MTRTPRRRRRGATVVELAIVLPVLILLLLGLVVGAMGTFRYQEVCHLAREGARYAAVRGKEYAREGKTTAATAEDIYNNAIKPQIVCLDESRLSYSVTWNSVNEPSTVSTDYEHPHGNTVTVTVTYEWYPEKYLFGPIRLSSSATVPMSH